MQAINFQFDVSTIDPYVGGGEPLPTGTYPMAISAMECVPNTKAETGHNLKMTYTVIEGEFKGRKVFENLNLWHKTSSQAVEIAWKHLSSIGRAVGVMQGNDLTVLANKPMLVDISLEPGTPASIDENGREVKARGPQNRIQRRDPYAAQAAAQSAPQPVSQPNAAAAAQAPAFAQPQPAASAAPAAQAAPAFPAAVAQPAASAAMPQPSGTPSGATPPWAQK